KFTLNLFQQLLKPRYRLGGHLYDTVFFFSPSINQERGTKVEKTNTSPLNMNPRVLTLIQELSDYEWHN
ncbi:hypothetical protein Z043_105353, partial [Scleropages formosus]